MKLNLFLSNLAITQNVYVQIQKNLSFHRTLKQLSNDSSIKNCKFDKGKETAILNKKDYFWKLDYIIEDKCHTSFIILIITM